MKKQILILLLIQLGLPFTVTFQQFSLAQNKKIDSLKQILLHQQEDTNKVNTLHSIAQQYKNVNKVISRIDF